ncbi:MAG: response regulator [Cytophagales bacterium]|nr:MAG: response regulator [Cytophagales bacterium]
MDKSINWNAYKTQYLASRSQFIIFEAEGRIIDSCYTIIPASLLAEKNFFDFFPLFESLREEVLSLQMGNMPLQFPRVEIEDQIFDFSVEKVEQYWLCIIEKNSADYQYISDLQQLGKTSAIEKEKIELQNQLLELKNQELKRMEQFKTQFFSEISHELRTPVNGIVGLVNLLLDTTYQLNAQQMSYLKAIQSSGNHIVTIINDILDLSKIESGKMTFEEVCFNLDDVLQNVILSFQQMAQSKGIQVSYSLGASVPRYVWGDKVRLAQIFYNLVGNAVKFTHEGEVTLNATKTLAKEDDIEQFYFQVSDTGIGMAKEKLAYIFERYTQADTNTTRLYGGTGLGLSIVKQLIELQKGSMSVESELQKGTTFFFDLPYRKATATEIAENQLTEKNDFLPFEKKAKILIADDNEVNLMVNERMLLSWNCEVFKANDGRKALELLINQPFDIVFLDIQMPEINGVELATFIKGNQAIQTTLIGLTGTMLNEQEKQLFQEVLLKPIAKADMYHCLQRWLLMPSQRNMINLAYLRKVSEGDEEFVQKALLFFEEGTKEEMQNLKTALNAKKWYEVWNLAHKMKSSFKLLGVLEAVDLLERIESMAQEGEDLVQIPNMFLRLEDIAEGIMNELQQYK